MRRQAGQAMAEFAVATAVLSLVLLGTLAIGGYQEVDRRAVMTSRQSAWLQGWSPQGVDAAALSEKFHRELFADSGVREPAGRRLLVAEEDLQVQAGRVMPGGRAGATAQALRLPLRVTGGLLGASFDLDERGMTQGVVRTRIAPIDALPAPFDTLELHLQAATVLLDDAWHAAGVEHVERRAGGLVPLSRLRALNAIWRPLSIPLGIFEPSLRQLCLGLIEPDRIPEDRLGPGSTPLPTGCP